MTAVRPFEWLTSAESLHAKLQQALVPHEGSPSKQKNDDQDTRVLHVGCGSSVLGEYMVTNFNNVVQEVVNVDSDPEIIHSMQKRWTERRGRSRDFLEPTNNDDDDKMKFVVADLCQESIPDESDGSFDVVVDKSTLDCLLCSDRGASSLISEVHRLLDPQNGVYLLVSFHHMDLLKPLLEDCPGTDWTLSHSVMYRNVEALVGVKNNDGTAPQSITNLEHVPLPETIEDKLSPWAPGRFQPNEVYHRTVNVIICRKQGNQSIVIPLDHLAVYDHVNRCSDQWYQQQNPILTTKRAQQIRKAFPSPLSLSESYRFLFTEEEREHLTYEAFLEDWTIFSERHPDLAKDEISSEAALCFLSEMQ